MKKILIRFRQWILKYRKRLVYGALALFIGQICFFNFGWIGIENQVFAQSETTSQSPAQSQSQMEKVNEWGKILSFLNKIVYVLIYPMLVLAGKLVDNSFVYGEVFWFDAILWQLWNIVRNLANFTLWFILLYKIFKYLINWKEKVKEIILSALIAWIWIQASWFVMAALIDASTILTYAVWWLPISVLKDLDKTGTSTEYNPYILKNVIDVDVQDISDMHVYLTNTQVWDKKSGEFYISECETFAYESWSRETKLILAPKMTYYKKNTWDYIPTDANRCHYYGQVYYFSNLYEGGGNSTNLKNFVEGNKFVLSNGWTGGTQDKYMEVIKNSEVTIQGLTWDSVIGLISGGTLLEIWDAHATWWVVWGLWTGTYSSGNEWWLDVDNKWTGIGWTTSKLQDILNGHSYVGVFTALYTSLMNSWGGVINSDSTAAQVLNSALSLWHSLAVWIPLIVVAVVFMIRIGVLWIAIAISPFIVLAIAFKDIGDKVFEKGWKGMFSYLHISNLIPIIFSPAIICFAISMSTVLVHIIQWTNKNLIETENTEILWWLIEMNVGSMTVPIGKLVVSVLGIALTWFLVWAAIESSKIWKSDFIQSVKDLAKTTLWSIPIVPVPGKDRNGVQFIWANSAFGLNGQQWALSQINSKLKTKFEGGQKALDQLIDPETARETAQKNAKANRFDLYKNGLDTASIGNNWIQTYAINIPNDALGNNVVNTSFENLESDEKKKEIIDAINALEENKRKAFWTVASIQIWDTTRKFDTNVNKYVEQKSTNSTPSGNTTPTSS